MPNSIAQAPDGTIYIASGFDPVLRWRGISLPAELAGVAAPTSKVSMVASGNGQIVGTYYAYLRYVDRDGRLSNLTPISAKTVINGNSGDVAGASNTVPIQITTANHGLSTGDQIVVSNVAGNTAANGTYLVTNINADTFSLQTLDGVDVAGNGTYAGGGSWIGGAEKITYSNLEVPQDAQIERRQILRNANGNTATFYVDVDTTDLTSTSIDSYRADSSLTGQTAVPLFDGNGVDLAVSRYGVPPNDLTSLLHVNGRMFFAGDAEYSQGAVSVTFGSTSVTGVGTEWTSSLVGRLLHVDGVEGVTISAVDTTNQTLTLSEGYPGSTEPYADYRIRSIDTRRRSIAWSESGLPDAVPAVNALIVNADQSLGDITGMFRLGSLMYLGERDRLHVLSFLRNPAPQGAGGDGSIFHRTYRGMISQRCVVIVEDMAYILDREGIHQFAGNDDQPISVSIQDLFDRNGYYDWRVRWEHEEFFHAVHDGGQQVIRFFVTLGCTRYPYHAICYAYRTQRWWIEEYPFPITSSTEGEVAGEPVVFVGSTANRVFVLGMGSLDGVDAEDGNTHNGTVTSSTVDSVTVSGATFASSMVGYPVVITSGTGIGQRRTIRAVSGTTLSVDVPWTKQPDTTTKFTIGGIQWHWRSRVFRFAPEEKGNARKLFLNAKPGHASDAIRLRTYLNESATAENWGLGATTNGVTTEQGDENAILDPTKTDGFWTLNLDGNRQSNLDGDRLFEVQIDGVQGETPQQIYSLRIDGVTG